MSEEINNRDEKVPIDIRISTKMGHIVYSTIYSDGSEGSIQETDVKSSSVPSDAEGHQERVNFLKEKFLNIEIQRQKEPENI